VTTLGLNKGKSIREKVELKPESAYCEICRDLIKCFRPFIWTATLRQLYDLNLRSVMVKCPVYKVLWKTAKMNHCFVCQFAEGIHNRICAMEIKNLASIGKKYDHWNVPYIPPKPEEVKKKNEKESKSEMARSNTQMEIPTK